MKFKFIGFKKNEITPIRSENKIGNILSFLKPKRYNNWLLLSLNVKIINEK